MIEILHPVIFYNNKVLFVHDIRVNSKSEIIDLVLITKFYENNITHFTLNYIYRVNSEIILSWLKRNNPTDYKNISLKYLSVKQCKRFNKLNQIFDDK